MHRTILLALLVVTLPLLAAVSPVRADAEGALPTLEEVRQRIEEKGYSWTAGETSLSRLSAEEFKGRLATRLPEDYDLILERMKSRPPAYAPLDLPSRFDWGDSISLPPIREQLCGDCWAQAVTTALECQFRLHDHDTTAVAVQQAIDCNYGSSNCLGGFMSDACFLYTHIGAVAEECYPYVGATMECTFDTCGIIARLDSSAHIDTTVASIKTHLMEYGPIPVALAVPADLQYYTGGCFESEEPILGWHALVVIGWEDSMCGGYGAWHLWNSSGTDWGEDGFAWIKYHTGHIGADAQILHYTSKGSVQLAVESFAIDDAAGNGDSIADPGESVALSVRLSNDGWLTATGVSATLFTSTPGINVTTGSATFPDIDPDSTCESNPPHFAFTVDSDVLCGRIAEFLLSVSSDQGVTTDEIEIIVGGADVVFADDAESDLGWSKRSPDDEATAGTWRRKNPVGTATYTTLIQPELDHTPGNAVRCFVTANAMRNLPPGTGDVDGGKITLTTPVIDLSDRASAALRYRRWYTNDTSGVADDVWAVDVSPDTGLTWVNLETLATSQREWVRAEFDLNGAIALTHNVIVRFVASDYGDDSVVEAGVDDFEVFGCPYWVDTSPPFVTVLGPNGGEVITESTESEISWAAGDDYGLRDVSVLVSYDGGMTFADTLGSVRWPDTTFCWSVPTGEHPECLVRVEVTDRGYNAAADESDSTFAIVEDVSGLAGADASTGPLEVDLVGSERNPFTAMTHIFYGVPAGAHVSMGIYSVTGRRVKALVDGHVESGYHSAVWDGRSDSGERVAPGVYFVHISASGVARTAKVVLER